MYKNICYHLLYNVILSKKRKLVLATSKNFPCSDIASSASIKIVEILSKTSKLIMILDISAAQQLVLFLSLSLSILPLVTNSTQYDIVPSNKLQTKKQASFEPKNSQYLHACIIRMHCINAKIFGSHMIRRFKILHSKLVFLSSRTKAIGSLVSFLLF